MVKVGKEKGRSGWYILSFGTNTGQEIAVSVDSTFTREELLQFVAELIEWLAETAPKTEVKE